MPWVRLPPTYLTNEPSGIGGRKRLWWAVQGWDQGESEGVVYEPFQARSTNQQLAWFAYIQKLARKHGFAESLPVDPRFHLDSMGSRLHRVHQQSRQDELSHSAVVRAVRTW